MGAVKNTVIAASIAAIIPAIAVGVGEAHASGCENVKHFAVGGVGDPTSSHVPGAPANAERIEYSASIFPVGSVPGEQSKLEAQRKLDRRARAYRAACPNSHITVHGYSLGALAAGDTRDSWNRDSRMNKNVNFVLVADGRAKNGAMVHAPAGLLGFTKTGPRPKSVIPTSSTCRTNDAVCNLGPITNFPHFVNAIAGYLGGDHLYSSREVNPAPGNHWVKPKKVAPVIRTAQPVIVEEPAPEPRVTVNEVLPEPVRQYVPPQVREIVIPQNVLPQVPVIKLPPLPRITLPKIG